MQRRTAPSAQPNDLRQLYIDEHTVTGHELREPLAELHAAQRAHKIASSAGLGADEISESAHRALLQAAPQRTKATQKTLGGVGDGRSHDRGHGPGPMFE